MLQTDRTQRVGASRPSVPRGETGLLDLSCFMPFPRCSLPSQFCQSLIRANSLRTIGLRLTLPEPRPYSSTSYISASVRSKTDVRQSRSGWSTVSSTSPDISTRVALIPLWRSAMTGDTPYAEVCRASSLTKSAVPPLSITLRVSAATASPSLL